MSEDRKEVFERVREVDLHGKTVDDSIRILEKLKEKHNEEYYELSLRLGFDGEDHIVLNLHGKRKEDDTERKERISKRMEFERKNEEFRVKEEKEERKELERLLKKYMVNKPCP